VLKRVTSRFAILLAATALLAGALGASGAFGQTSGEIVTYVSTATIPVPPASNYAGTGGGDGWDVSLSTTQVFNVFHHNGSLTVACHQQSDASECYPARTITDNGSGFSTSGHSGTYFDVNTGRLWVYAISSNTTAGVVCVDTTIAAANPNPFCGFVPLSATGEGGPLSTSVPMRVGNRLYAFNYVNGTPSGTKDTLLCLDIGAAAACAGQPFSVNIGAGAVSVGTFPVPATGLIGDQMIIPINTGGTGRIACFDDSLQGNCAGSFPVDFAAAGSNGAPFERLDAAGNLIGFCFPSTGIPCFDLSGASVATPAGITSVITPNTQWNGHTIVIGPRVYIANGTIDQIQCFDYSTGASCANFPHSTTGADFIYTVNPDFQRPTCIWINADNGPSQIQNFDAFSGGPCGQGAIRILASQFIVPQQVCQPTTYRFFEVLQPDRSTYTDGTVGFATFNGSPTGIPDQPIGPTGAVDLAGLGLENVDRPQFLVTINGSSNSLSQAVLRLTWDAAFDPACVAANVEVIQTPSVPIAPNFTG